MQSAEAKKAALETKLTQLRITSERTEIVLTSGKREAIERHLVALKTTISKSDHWKRAVEELKIGESEDLMQISVWSASVDAKLMLQSHSR